MAKIFLIPCLVALALASAGCSRSNRAADERLPEPAASIDKTSEAYRLGTSHADELLSTCHDNSSRHDKILDVRARASLIESRLGSQAAGDYSAGFRDRLVEKGDTLGTVLF